jgi:DNA invertase Pin-like site-specific DNA recombinase
MKRSPGLSYTRFSDLHRQGDGDSQDRQDKMFRDFCQRHDLIPLLEVYADRGRSGYKDEHRKKGRLGQLIALAKAGGLEPGTVVVVEAWDRLGRLRPDRQTELVAELLRTGVCIGVCQLDDIFCEEDFGTHKWTTLAVFIQLAYQESKQKAERVAASWKTRREKARENGTPIRCRIPSWLELVDGKFRPIPEKVAAIKRVFALAAEGKGFTRLLAVLRREGVPPIGRGKRCKRWTRPYLRWIVTDRRVLGEFQPRDVEGKPLGDPIKAYYPAVVTQEEYELARATAAANGGPRGKKTRQRRHVNVFRGLLVHAPDGESLQVRNKGTAAAPRLVLINAAGYEGRGVSRSFPYEVFEDGILSRLREVKAMDVQPSKGTGPSKADVLKARKDNIEADLASLKADVKKKYSKTLSEVIGEKEDELAQVATELQEELARSARPAAKAWDDLPGLVDLIRTAEDPAGARLQVRLALRTVVETIAVLIVSRGSWRLCAAQVWFHGGAHRDYLLRYRTAAHRRPEQRLPPLDDRFEFGEDALDLRRKEDTAALESLLTTTDLATLLAR